MYLNEWKGEELFRKLKGEIEKIYFREKKLFKKKKCQEHKKQKTKNNRHNKQRPF